MTKNSTNHKKMKVEEKEKINIELSREEYYLLRDSENLIEEIRDILNKYEKYNGVYKDWIDNSIEGIIKILYQLQKGF